jgi:hypothetical protein
MRRVLWQLTTAIVIVITCYGQNSVVAAKSKRSPELRMVSFSGYEWKVKSSTNPVGPGPNYFSDSSDNIKVDAQGRLHLRITQRNGRWHCAEVVSVRSFGYGTYRFYLDAPVDNLDPRIILGLFTWSDSPAYSHREIDVEISRWGDAGNENAQFVIQPYSLPMNIVRFQIPPGLNASTHSFIWRPESVVCQSIKGLQANQPETDSVIHQHTFTKGIPQAGSENARINLWLMSGQAPIDGKETEIVISKFEFIPLL